MNLKELLPILVLKCFTMDWWWVLLKNSAVKPTREGLFFYGDLHGWCSLSLGSFPSLSLWVCFLSIHSQVSLESQELKYSLFWRHPYFPYVSSLFFVPCGSSKSMFTRSLYLNPLILFNFLQLCVFERQSYKAGQRDTESDSFCRLVHSLSWCFVRQFGTLSGSPIGVQSTEAWAHLLMLSQEHEQSARLEEEKLELKHKPSWDSRIADNGLVHNATTPTPSSPSPDPVLSIM